MDRQKKSDKQPRPRDDVGALLGDAKHCIRRFKGT
jgi:hypothetical protein